MKHQVIAVTNQKGGVGKTTTAVHFAHGLVLINPELRVLLIDLDPQGNATQGSGLKLDDVGLSIADLIRDRLLPTEKAIYSNGKIDLLPATPLLSKVEREMVGTTNSELRLARRLEALSGAYDVVVLDTPPTFGPLMNSALNAATKLIVPVDSSFYAMVGIKELLSEIEEIRVGINEELDVLGYLLTLSDHTRMSQEIFSALNESFGDLVFHSRIRRSVRLKEASAFGKTIFELHQQNAVAIDYMSFCREAIERLEHKHLCDVFTQAEVSHE